MEEKKEEGEEAGHKEHRAAESVHKSKKHVQRKEL